MKHGIKYLCCHKPEFLTKAGYRLVPKHCESNLEVHAQWISNIDNFGNSHFPRFHIIHKDHLDGWFIHYDYFKDGEHRSIDYKCPELKQEIKRLNILYAQSITICPQTLVEQNTKS